ncbi:MAG: HNH endonuclease signature motif containing protein, partial [Acidimicrobiia bacterium]
LQVDHRKPFAQLGPTDLENCALLCKLHHDMKTYLGWVLARAADGSWTFSPPDDYRDPEPVDPALGELVGVDPWTGRAAEPHPARAGADERGVPTPATGLEPAWSEPAGLPPEWDEQLALVGASGPSP